MRAPEILTLMGHLSVGNDNITPTERAIFLHYLNLAHLELYQDTANFNESLVIKEDLEAQENVHTVTLSQTPYLVIGVYDRTHHRPLPRLSVMDDVGRGREGIGTGSGVGYSVQRVNISLIPPPIGNMGVRVWYVPQPSTLGEATEEGDIPYPVAYHPVLADGALYYLFQEEGGFKSTTKEGEAKKRWERGKAKLLSYLYSSSGQSLSTFSNA